MQVLKPPCSSKGLCVQANVRRVALVSGVADGHERYQVLWQLPSGTKAYEAAAEFMKQLVAWLGL